MALTFQSQTTLVKGVQGLQGTPGVNGNKIYSTSSGSTVDSSLTSIPKNSSGLSGNTLRIGDLLIVSGPNSKCLFKITGDTTTDYTLSFVFDFNTNLVSTLDISFYCTMTQTQFSTFCSTGTLGTTTYGELKTAADALTPGSEYGSESDVSTLSAGDLIVLNYLGTDPMLVTL